MFTSLANDLGHQHYCWLLYNGDTSPHIPMPYHVILMVSHGFPLKNDYYQQHSKTQNHNLEVSSNGASSKLRVSILSHGHPWLEWFGGTPNLGNLKLKLTIFLSEIPWALWFPKKAVFHRFVLAGRRPTAVHVPRSSPAPLPCDPGRRSPLASPSPGLTSEMEGSPSWLRGGRPVKQ